MSHPKTQDFVMVFSDETCEDRNTEKMEAFVSDLRRAANQLGFDVHSWGTRIQLASLFEERND